MCVPALDFPRGAEYLKKIPLALGGAKSPVTACLLCEYELKLFVCSLAFTEFIFCARRLAMSLLPGRSLVNSNRTARFWGKREAERLMTLTLSVQFVDQFL